MKASVLILLIVIINLTDASLLTDNLVNIAPSDIVHTVEKRDVANDEILRAKRCRRMTCIIDPKTHVTRCSCP